MVSSTYLAMSFFHQINTTLPHRSIREVFLRDVLEQSHQKKQG